MVPTIQILVLLLAVIAVVAVVAARLKIPSAILLVLTGVVLAVVPDLPVVELAPELVLLLVLPPVIYSSAVAMSWREFRFNLRPIGLLRRVHDDCSRRGNPLAVGFRLAGGFRTGRHSLAARRHRAALYRAQNAAPQADPRRARRRGTGK
jgi:hypothetical protein